MATHDRGRATSGAGGETALVVVCGLPGVGKSSVASWIADRLDAVHLRTDEIRKELFPKPEYTTDETDQVYQTLVNRGRAAVAGGRRAVLDATFKRRRHRIKPARVAGELGAPWRLVKVEADPAVVRDRIRARRNDPSDADVSIHEQFRDEFEPIQLDHVAIDNSGDFGETERELEERFPRERVTVPQ